MPLYVYKCQACAKIVESLAKSEDSPPPCPECGADTAKQMGKGSFHLKGSSWAKDGYA